MTPAALPGIEGESGSDGGRAGRGYPRPKLPATCRMASTAEM